MTGFHDAAIWLRRPQLTPSRMSVTVTWTICRQVDRHDPKRRQTITDRLHITAVGSDQLNAILAAELEAKAATIIASVANWERPASSPPPPGRSS